MSTQLRDRFLRLGVKQKYGRDTLKILSTQGLASSHSQTSENSTEALQKRLSQDGYRNPLELFRKVDEEQPNVFVRPRR